VAGGALAAGLGELALRLALRGIAQRIDNSFYLDPQAVWMGPLAAAPVMLVAAVVTRAVVRRWRPEAAGSAGIFGVAGLALLSLGFVTQRVHPAALALLAAGLAWQITAFARKRPQLFHRMFRAGTLGLAAVAVGGGVGWNVWRARREAQREAALPAARNGAPNVLLLILDTVRAWQLGAYGYPRPTSPRIDGFASGAIRFAKAAATSSWTLPSHATMFTGRYPFELQLDFDRPLSGEAPTLAERLGEAGYRTGGFVANTVYGSYLYGLNRGFQRYRDYPVTWTQLLGSSTINRRLVLAWCRRAGCDARFGDKTAGRVNGEFLSWLDRGPQDRPWFAFLNYFDAHMPYRPPAPYDMQFLAAEPPLRSVYQRPRRRLSPEEVAGLRDAYDGAVAYVDHEVGALLDELTRRGVLDRTLVVITSDHGEAFAEHAHVDHGGSLYLPELQVPLIVRSPGGTGAPCVVPDWVSLRDLAVTIGNVVGLERGGGFAGTSLVAHCPPGAEAPRSAVLAEIQSRSHLPGWYPVSAGDIRALIARGLHYVQYSDGREELFDLATDSLEQRNLAGDPGWTDRAASLRAMLDSLHRVGGR
jgi:arylsulfatase A-like enzyme